METRALRTFKAVARAGSFSRAAEALHCVQSNVSARIRQLEDELGAPLFHRGRHGAVLTPAGRVLDAYADRVLHLIGEARKAVDEAVVGAGAVAIGAMETTAAVRLPDLLAQFHAAFPKATLTLTTGHTEGLVRDVLGFKLDGAFVAGPIDAPELVQEPVFDEELVLVSAGDAVSVAEDTPPVLLAFRQGCTYRARSEQWLRESGQVELQIMEFGSLDAILGCAAAGMGLTLLPRALVERPHYRRTVSVRALPPRIARVPTYFVRHRDTLLTRPLAALVEMAAAGPDAEPAAARDR